MLSLHPPPLSSQTGPQHRSPAPFQSRIRLFSGTSNPTLSKEIAQHLGIDLGKITIKRFADNETYVRLDETVRGYDVFLVQPTCAPVNDNIMELLLTIDACKRASAKTVTAVVPYMGYARADRKTQGRESIAAKLQANILAKSGADRIIVMDLHSSQCTGYFDIPIENVQGDQVIIDYLVSKRLCINNVVVVSPDVGGVARARAFAKMLGDVPLAIVDKRRSGHNESEVMNLIGDVSNKVAILVDDMIDTAGTITQAGKVLRDQGAKEVYACATHAVLSPPAMERLSTPGVFTEVIVCNTIPVDAETRFTVLSVANVLGDKIWRVYKP
jgi:ribose-phosphate pyrophosphokinase